jgi:hypothetical protein
MGDASQLPTASTSQFVRAEIGIAAITTLLSRTLQKRYWEAPLGDELHECAESQAKAKDREAKCQRDSDESTDREEKEKAT